MAKVPQIDMIVGAPTAHDPAHALFTMFVTERDFEAYMRNFAASTHFWFYF